MLYSEFLNCKSVIEKTIKKIQETQGWHVFLFALKRKIELKTLKTEWTSACVPLIPETIAEMTRSSGRVRRGFTVVWLQPMLSAPHRALSIAPVLHPATTSH